MYQRAARASHGADRGHVRRNAVAAVRATCHGTWCAQHVVISTVVRSENLVALNLHGDAAGVFTDESLFVGGVLAQHAAVAMVGAAEVLAPCGPGKPRHHRSGQRHSDAPRQPHRIASIRGSDTGLSNYSGEGIMPSIGIIPSRRGAGRRQASLSDNASSSRPWADAAIPVIRSMASAASPAPPPAVVSTRQYARLTGVLDADEHLAVQVGRTITRRSSLPTPMRTGAAVSKR